MTKGIKNTIIIIGVILLGFAIIFAFYQHFQTEPMDANTTSDNILDDTNTGLGNMLNDILNEEIVNSEQKDENKNTETENKQYENTNTNINASTNAKKEENDATEDDNNMTPREKKAIDLVKEKWKKDWGSLKDVSFNVSIQSDGKYGVTVYDTTTTQSIQFYVVDVDTETIKER